MKRLMTVLLAWLCGVMALRGQEAAQPAATQPAATQPAAGIHLEMRKTPFADVKREGPSYRFIYLGDVHFDAEPDVYHKNYIIGEITPGRKKEFRRNADMWKERLPQLLKAASGKITRDTAFVIQAGDLVQGDCASPETHEKMVSDALAFMKTTFGEVPFLTTTLSYTCTSSP